MKQKIEDILTESGFADARAAKMDVDDLLKSVSFSCLVKLDHTLTDQTPRRVQRPGNVSGTSVDWCLDPY